MAENKRVFDSKQASKGAIKRLFFTVFANQYPKRLFDFIQTISSKKGSSKRVFSYVTITPPTEYIYSGEITFQLVTEYLLNYIRVYRYTGLINLNFLIDTYFYYLGLLLNDDIFRGQQIEEILEGRSRIFTFENWFEHREKKAHKLTRKFVIHYPVLTKEEFERLVDYFNFKLGNYKEILYKNPIDSHNYTVRFDKSSMQFEKFAKDLYKLDLVLEEVPD